MKLTSAELEAAFGGMLGVLSERFEDAGVPWMVIGGLAVSVWTEPRGTKDCDIALLLEHHTDVVAETISAAGIELTRAELHQIRNGGVARGRFRHDGATLMVDFLAGGTPFEKSALARRERCEVLGVAAWIVSSDDLLIYKLIAGRPQDLADVDKLIRFRRAPLDRAYVDRWAREWEVEDQLARAIELADR
ncbi:MAG: hypothetical protein JJ863_26270 [Deltaproteobacteria bacterium]|nr:hypothetical protein [Deltaproteobacteria bacterium]